MDLGLHYWNFSTPADPQRIADTLALAAKTAERAGFAEFNVMDHYFQIEQRGTADEPMLEGLHQGVIQDSRIGDCDPRVR
jgi:alkanesulfonate monooxygenase SsuD/methylene tetrahydromethanopterin reductase-like flavin-dependent oxidoreductase (luciferase family)